jgi:hypothetical protein
MTSWSVRLIWHDVLTITAEDASIKQPVNVPTYILIIMIDRFFQLLQTDHAVHMPLQGHNGSSISQCEAFKSR